MDWMMRMRNETARVILFVALAALPLGAWASEENESGEFILEDVVVTATRSETPTQDIAANITVLTAEEIDDMPVSTAAEALQYMPGVFVEFNGGPGSFSEARIHGSEVRHVAMFRDGCLLNQLSDPLTDLSDIYHFVQVEK